MPDWAYITQYRAGAAIADLSPFLKDRKVTLRLNRPPTASGTLNLSDPRADRATLQAGVHELKIRRNLTALDCVFSLVKATPTVGEVTSTLALEWQGIETYLASLTIPAATVENAAQSLHAWNRITAAQAKTGASVYAITRGLVPTTDPVKQRTYTDEVDVLGAVQQLAERSDGFDYQFNGSRQFDCYYPRRGSDLGLVFEYGKKLLELSYSEDAGPGAVGSDITTKGSVANATASDATAQLTYGRRDIVQTLPDVTDASGILQGYADATLAAVKTPIIIPSIRIDPTHTDNPWGSYYLGDIITVRCRAGNGSYVNINQKYRIVGIIIDINDVGSESITLELNDTLPLVLNQAIVDLKRDIANPSASNSIVQPTMDQRIAAIERQLT